MIGLDTNILVRYLTQDDPQQAPQATRIFEETLTDDNPGFIGLVVLVETIWVLRRLYQASAEELRQTVSDLLGSRTIVVESRDAVAQAVARAENNGVDFADAIIVASALDAGCREVLSFDRGAVRAGMTLVE